MGRQTVKGRRLYQYLEQLEFVRDVGAKHGDFDYSDPKENNMEILTVNDVAALLKLSKSQVYELTNKRTRDSEERKHPIP
jgi:hypothetical protein